MSVREMWNKSWNTNTTGSWIISTTFVPLLLKSTDPRIIFITSGTSTMGEHSNQAIFVNKAPPKGWPKQVLGVPAYRASKAGMNMMMLELARILREDGVKTWCVSPGYLATGLGGSQQVNAQQGAIDPSIGANFVKDVVEGVRDADVGKVIRKDDVQAW
jgi:NAD(P)-dependent dehydrogenase (short-subunit alcohol dehydrogenase family)